MERRLRAHRQALIAALVLASVPAIAAPSSPDARAEFDRGVAAYQKQDFAGASSAFGRSFELELDAETLFAWAQAERKLAHCDRANELYAKLLAMTIPAENQAVIRGQIAECQKIIAAQKQKPRASSSSTNADVTTGEVRPWYRDPVGGTFVVAGIVGLGVGGALLASAHAAQEGIATAPDYAAARSLHDQADSRGTLGSVAMLAGGACVVTAIVWYATHGSSARTTISGWLAPAGGGLALARGF